MAARIHCWNSTEGEDSNILSPYRFIAPDCGYLSGFSLFVFSPVIGLENSVGAVTEAIYRKSLGGVEYFVSCVQLRDRDPACTACTGSKIPTAASNKWFLWTLTIL